ncbi:MAG: hypothetical protein AAGA58_05020 [Verrucomicrobiota bacterium]
MKCLARFLALLLAMAASLSTASAQITATSIVVNDRLTDGSGTHSVFITWKAPAGQLINASSLGTDDITVTGPFDNPMVVSTSAPGANANEITIEYLMIAPVGFPFLGNWSSNLDGTYNVNLVAGQVVDTGGGNGNAAQSAAATFQVQVIYIMEEFSGGVSPTGFSNSTAGEVEFSGGNADFGQINTTTRGYLYTNFSDYLTRGFSFEITVTVGASPAASGFIGLGPGTALVSESRIPSPPNAHLTFSSSSISPFAAITSDQGSGAGSTQMGDGTHRVLLHSDGQSLQVAVMRNASLGTPFVPTYVFPLLDVASLDFTSSNSSLFFGGNGALSFDNISITPFAGFEPGSGDYFIWSGDLSGDWFDSGNWVGNVVPPETANVILPDFAINKSISSAPLITVNSLSVQSGVCAYSISCDALTNISGVYDVSGEFDLQAAAAGNNGLTVTGPAGSAGTMKLFSNPAIYNGPTSIERGTLDIIDPVIPPATHVDVAAGATFRMAGSIDIPVGGLTGAGRVEIGNGISLDVNGGQSTPAFSGEFSGKLTGAGGLKVRSSTFTVSGNSNDFQGNTDLQLSMVKMTNSSGSAFGTGTVGVTGTVLGGIGSTSGNTTGDVASTLSPGLSPGTVGFGANLTWPGTMGFEIDGTAVDRVDVTGNLNLTGTTLALTETGSGATQNVYIIATYGTLTANNQTTATGIPVGYVIQYDYNDGNSSNNIALVKPTTFTQEYIDTFNNDFFVGSHWDQGIDPEGTSGLTLFVRNGANPFGFSDLFTQLAALTVGDHMGDGEVEFNESGISISGPFSIGSFTGSGDTQSYNSVDGTARVFGETAPVYDDIFVGVITLAEQNPSVQTHGIMEVNSAASLTFDLLALGGMGLNGTTNPHNYSSRGEGRLDSINTLSANIIDVDSAEVTFPAANFSFDGFLELSSINSAQIGLLNIATGEFEAASTSFDTNVEIRGCSVQTATAGIKIGSLNISGNGRFSGAASVLFLGDTITTPNGSTGITIGGATTTGPGPTFASVDSQFSTIATLQATAYSGGGFNVLGPVSGGTLLGSFPCEAVLDSSFIQTDNLQVTPGATLTLKIQGNTATTTSNTLSSGLYPRIEVSDLGSIATALLTGFIVVDFDYIPSGGEVFDFIVAEDFDATSDELGELNLSTLDLTPGLTPTFSVVEENGNTILRLSLTGSPITSFNWIAGTDDYQTGANWSGGAVPSGANTATIANGGTAQATSSDVRAEVLSIGDVTTGQGGNLEVTGVNVEIGNSLAIGAAGQSFLGNGTLDASATIRNAPSVDIADQRVLLAASNFTTPGQNATLNGKLHIIDSPTVELGTPDSFESFLVIGLGTIDTTGAPVNVSVDADVLIRNAETLSLPQLQLGGIIGDRAASGSQATGNTSLVVENVTGSVQGDRVRLASGMTNNNFQGTTKSTSNLRWSNLGNVTIDDFSGDAEPFSFNGAAGAFSEYAVNATFENIPSFVVNDLFFDGLNHDLFGSETVDGASKVDLAVNFRNIGNLVIGNSLSFAGLSYTNLGTGTLSSRNEITANLEISDSRVSIEDGLSIGFHSFRNQGPGNVSTNIGQDIRCRLSNSFLDTGNLTLGGDTVSGVVTDIGSKPVEFEMNPSFVKTRNLIIDRDVTITMAIEGATRANATNTLEGTSGLYSAIDVTDQVSFFTSSGSPTFFNVDFKYLPSGNETFELIRTTSLGALSGYNFFEVIFGLPAGMTAQLSVDQSQGYDRLLLTLTDDRFIWNVAGPANFATAGNWLNNTVPGPSDTALIGNNGIAVGTTDVTIANLFVGDTLAGGDGTLRLTDANFDHSSLSIACACTTSFSVSSLLPNSNVTGLVEITNTSPTFSILGSSFVSIGTISPDPAQTANFNGTLRANKVDALNLRSVAVGSNQSNTITPLLGSGSATGNFEVKDANSIELDTLSVGRSRSGTASGETQAIAGTVSIEDSPSLVLDDDARVGSTTLDSHIGNLATTGNVSVSSVNFIELDDLEVGFTRRSEGALFAGNLDSNGNAIFRDATSGLTIKDDFDCGRAIFSAGSSLGTTHSGVIRTNGTTTFQNIPSVQANGDFRVGVVERSGLSPFVSDTVALSAIGVVNVFDVPSFTTTDPVVVAGGTISELFTGAAGGTYSSNGTMNLTNSMVLCPSLSLGAIDTGNVEGASGAGTLNMTGSALDVSAVLTLSESPNIAEVSMNPSFIRTSTFNFGDATINMAIQGTTRATIANVLNGTPGLYSAIDVDNQASKGDNLRIVADFSGFSPPAGTHVFTLIQSSGNALGDIGPENLFVRGLDPGFSFSFQPLEATINVTITGSPAFFWTNPGTGDYQTTTNWSSNLVPGLFDDAVIANGGTAQVTAPSRQTALLDSLLVGDFSGSGNGSIDLGNFDVSVATSLAVAAPSNLTTFPIPNGANQTVTGNARFSSASFLTAGQTAVGVVNSLPGQTHSVDGSLSVDNFTHVDLSNVEAAVAKRTTNQLEGTTNSTARLLFASGTNVIAEDFVLGSAQNAPANSETTTTMGSAQIVGLSGQFEVTRALVLGQVILNQPEGAVMSKGDISFTSLPTVKIDGEFLMGIAEFSGGDFIHKGSSMAEASLTATDLTSSFTIGDKFRVGQIVADFESGGEMGPVRGSIGARGQFQLKNIFVCSFASLDLGSIERIGGASAALSSGNLTADGSGILEDIPNLSMGGLNLSYMDVVSGNISNTLSGIHSATSRLEVINCRGALNNVNVAVIQQSIPGVTETASAELILKRSALGAFDVTVAPTNATSGVLALSPSFLEATNLNVGAGGRIELRAEGNTKATLSNRAQTGLYSNVFVINTAQIDTLHCTIAFLPASGSTFDLATAGTDVNLPPNQVINLPAGYAHTLERVTESGNTVLRLTVNGAPTDPFQIWLAANGLPIDSLATQTTAFNNRPLGMHFALNTDPNGDGTDEGKIRGQVYENPNDNKSYFTYTIPVRKDVTLVDAGNEISGQVASIQYLIHAVDDLRNNFGNIAIDENPVVLDSGLPALQNFDDNLDSTNPDWAYQTFFITTPLDQLTHAFFRTVISG